MELHFKRNHFFNFFLLLLFIYISQFVVFTSNAYIASCRVVPSFRASVYDSVSGVTTHLRDIDDRSSEGGAVVVFPTERVMVFGL
jgi:hypothetical protein